MGSGSFFAFGVSAWSATRADGRGALEKSFDLALQPFASVDALLARAAADLFEFVGRRALVDQCPIACAPCFVIVAKGPELGGGTDREIHQRAASWATAKVINLSLTPFFLTNRS